MIETPSAVEDPQPSPEAKQAAAPDADEAARYAAEVATVPPELRPYIQSAEFRVRVGGIRKDLLAMVRDEARWAEDPQMRAENWGE